MPTITPNYRRIEQATDPEFLRAVREQTLAAGFRIDSCIASTKLYLRLIDAEWGLVGMPLTVRACALNRPMAKLFRQHNHNPEQRKVLRCGRKAGGRFVIVGDRKPVQDGERFWPGHLVAVIVTSRRWTLVDLTIDQAHRPDRDLLLHEPIAMDVPEPWVKGAGGLVVVENFRGSSVSYEAFPDDRSYQDTPAWTDPLEVVFNGREL